MYKTHYGPFSNSDCIWPIHVWHGPAGCWLWGSTPLCTSSCAGADHTKQHSPQQGLVPAEISLSICYLWGLLDPVLKFEAGHWIDLSCRPMSGTVCAWPSAACLEQSQGGFFYKSLVKDSSAASLPLVFGTILLSFINSCNSSVVLVGGECSFHLLCRLLEIPSHYENVLTLPNTKTH